MMTKKIYAAIAAVALAVVAMLATLPSANADSPTTTLAKETTPIDPGTFNQSTVSCPNGMVVTGGGIDISGSDPGNTDSALIERYSGPVYGGTGWTLGETNTGDIQLSFTVVAICISGTTTG
jgi:hypothetical protein